MAGEADVVSQVRDTNCSGAPRRQAAPSAPMSEDEVEQDDDDDEDDEEMGAGAPPGGADAGNETGSSGRPNRGTKRKKVARGGKRPSAPVSDQSAPGRRPACCGVEQPVALQSAACCYAVLL